MKNKPLLLTLVIFNLIFQSCSNSDDNEVVNENQADISQSLINGWWYRGQDAFLYKGYYFGSDGVYKQDGSNFGIPMGVGNWTWLTSTKVKVTPVSGMVGEGTFDIVKLTSDSLVTANPTMKLSRTNHD